MTNSIKIFTTFLVVLAVFSLFSFFDVFHGVRSVSLFEPAKSLPPLPNDSDSDGLTDSEESYWNTDFLNPDTDRDGYLDGEEVASGHDPIEPGPDDLLIKKMNLTEASAELVVAGLSEGFLKLDSDNFEESLAVISNLVMDGADSALNKDVSHLNLNLVDSSKENQDKYLNDIYEIIKEFLTTYGDELQELDKKLD